MLVSTPDLILVCVHYCTIMEKSRGCATVVTQKVRPGVETRQGTGRKKPAR